jgi:hypothetical protein
MIQFIDSFYEKIIRKNKWDLVAVVANLIENFISLKKVIVMKIFTY